MLFIVIFTPVKVRIGGRTSNTSMLLCDTTTTNQTTVTCLLRNHSAGEVQVFLHVEGLGYTNTQMFVYDLIVSSVQPAISGFGGGTLLTVTGKVWFQLPTSPRLETRKCFSFAIFAIYAKKIANFLFFIQKVS